MKKSIIIYLHLLFWSIIIITLYIIPMVLMRLHPEPPSIDLSYALFILPICFYSGYLGITRASSKRKFFLISSVIILFSYPLFYFISKNLFVFVSIGEYSSLLWITIGSLFGFFVDWYNKKKDIIVLEKENMASNLAMLKFQINPHFLFNTLHNIDTLIHKNQDKASKSLIKLSDIMRYMLHDAKSELVELEKEIEHLQNYLSLEQLRLKNEKFLNYSINGNPRGINIAPMIMIPFVENAFKHSVDSNIENGITIHVTIEKNTFNFKCENYFDTSDTDKDNAHGIGLDTVKKRLNLIYKDMYDLSIRSNNSIFKVDLKIELHEN